MLEDLHEVLYHLIKEGGSKCNNEPGLAFVYIPLSNRLFFSHNFLIVYVFTRVYAKVSKMPIDLIYYGRIRRGALNV